LKGTTLLRSFRNALGGLLWAYGSERNMRIHVCAGAWAFSLAYLGGVGRGDFLQVALAVFLVWIAELANTALEAVADLASGGEYHPLVGRAKNAAAGGVLLAATYAVLVGAWVLLPAVRGLPGAAMDAMRSAPLATGVLMALDLALLGGALLPGRIWHRWVRNWMGDGN